MAIERNFKSPYEHLVKAYDAQHLEHTFENFRKAYDELAMQLIYLGASEADIYYLDAIYERAQAKAKKMRTQLDAFKGMEEKFARNKIEN